MAHFLQADFLSLFSIDRACAWTGSASHAHVREQGGSKVPRVLLPTAAGYCNVRRPGELHVCMRVHMDVGLD